MRLLVFALLLLAAPAAEFDILYLVDVTRPESGRIHVTMIVRGETGDEERVAIPAWAPGAYRIRNYYEAIGRIRASTKPGRALKIEREGDRTWKIETGGTGRFWVDYELKVDSRRLNASHCFIPGPETFLYVTGHKEARHSVRFSVPPDWKIASGLDLEGDRYVARDYDTFIDAPTELGRFRLYAFEQEGVTYEIAIDSEKPIDGEKMAEMCGRVAAEHNRMMGGAPFRRYLFIYHLHNRSGGGGLEHLNSTHISMPYARLKEDPYSAASITSHEYFHLWNVKRIRPAQLGPFDYTGIVRTRALWLCEGGTSYFGDRALARSGIWSEERYFEHLAGEIEALQNNPDREVTSVEKASQSTWDRRDWPRVDYYNKGELICLLLDLKIRTMSEGRRNLDHVLRSLYENYVLAREGSIGIGYPEEGILQAINAVSGGDFSDFYRDHISGVVELPYEAILGAAGLDVKIQEVEQAALPFARRGTRVMEVTDALKEAGIKRRNRITALNGEAVTGRKLRTKLAKLKPGVEVTLTIADKEIRVTLVAKKRATCSIRRSEDATRSQTALLDGWLKGK